MVVIFVGGLFACLADAGTIDTVASIGASTYTIRLVAIATGTGIWVVRTAPVSTSAAGRTAALN